MTTRVALTQRYEYQFSRPVQLSTHWLRLRPAPHTQCSISAYSLRIDADPVWLNWLRDPFENHLARLDLPDPVASLMIEVDLIANLDPVNPFDFLVEPYAASYPFDYPDQLRKELAPYLRTGKLGPRLTKFFQTVERTSGYITEQIGAINQHVADSISAAGPGKPGPVDLETVLEKGRGTAWELAWLLTLTLRSVGLAARMTQGYRIFIHAEADVDTASNHAWSEVFLPGAGWIGLDPCGGVFINEGYIPLASAPEPLRVLPIAGYRESCDETFNQTISTRRLSPKPSTWPLSDSQWTDLQSLGAYIDADLNEQNINLAMANGLSFVSANDVQSLEWNIAALGPGKRFTAEQLLQRLWRRLAPGGVLHVGQGEQFGGEALPRWNLNCFARADGKPVWRNAALLEWGNNKQSVSLEDAEQLADQITHALGLSSKFVMPAYEDGLQKLWSNRDSLDNIPSAEELNDPEKRRALAATLSSSQAHVVGYVLPLRWDAGHERWSSGRWQFRRDALYLLSGSSPLGYRLPLESLPVANGAPTEMDPERCQFDERGLLPDMHGELSARLSSYGRIQAKPPAADAKTADAAPRTALCIEVRDNRLYIFMPPLTHLEHYLGLLAVIEHAAEALALPLTLQGYEPPQDCRLRRFKLEPQAGILKVWLPEAHGWQQQREIIQATYDEADRIGLQGERVINDGRRLPPGGGAELTLGGVTPRESPFLCRPELLRSLVSFWQQHPSLSFFFAGRSIGAGGDAPRPDEGRDESLYELGIALERIPKGEIDTPWMPDRLLRHLLVDPAGDMQRAEISVDQLYSPDQAGLRLGRVVLRSFEMPPDAKLASLQSLLVMGLLSYFGRQPQKGSLSHWGAALHDRFMLPSLLWQDLCGVLDELNHAGYPFQSEWFEPLRELHFPVLGSVQLGDIGLELRAALEPWPLLAEETTAAGVARFVDSANERLEVHITGLTPSRYALVCNGRRVPLQPAGMRGEYVAGVRYKASNPPSTLHPTIPPVAVLVFDLVDSWTDKSVGGCTYTPTHSPVLGAASAPMMMQQPELSRERDRDKGRALSLPPILISPSWSGGGKFSAKASGLEVVTITADERGSDHTYLLDLNRAPTPIN